MKKKKNMDEKSKKVIVFHIIFGFIFIGMIISGLFHLLSIWNDSIEHKIMLSIIFALIFFTLFQIIIKNVNLLRNKAHSQY